MGLTSAGDHTNHSKLLSLCVEHHEDWSTDTALAQALGATRPCRRLPGRTTSEKIREVESPWEGPSPPSARPGNVDSRGVAQCTAHTGSSKGQSRCRGPYGPAPTLDTGRTESDRGPDGGRLGGAAVRHSLSQYRQVWVSRRTANGTDRSWLWAGCLRPGGKWGQTSDPMNLRCFHGGGGSRGAAGGKLRLAPPRGPESFQSHRCRCPMALSQL